MFRSYIMSVKGCVYITSLEIMYCFDIRLHINMSGIYVRYVGCSIQQVPGRIRHHYYDINKV